MGWMTGFEPATSGSTIRRSNQLSYTHHTGLKNRDINKGPTAIATQLQLPTCIKCRLHLRQDSADGRSRICRITNRSTDHQIVRSSGNGLRRRRRASMVIDPFAGRPDTRRHDREMRPDFLAECRGFFTGRDDTVAADF